MELRLGLEPKILLAPESTQCFPRIHHGCFVVQTSAAQSAFLFIIDVQETLIELN